MAKQNSQFLVIGLGKLGQSIVYTLFENGAEVLAVDSDINDINEISKYATESICADAVNEAVLEKLGIKHYDAVIVCIGDVEANIFVTLLCKQMGAKKLIVKAQNDLHREVLLKIGADRVIIPEEEVGHKLADTLFNPNMIELTDLTQTYKLIEIRTPPKWANKSLIDLNVRNTHRINIVLVKREEEVISYLGGDFVLLAGDLLVIGGEEKDLSKLKTKATQEV